MSTRYLVVAPAWVGDMVMAQSLLKLLKQRQPDCIVDVVAPASTYPLLQRMDEVDGSFRIDVTHGGVQWQERRRLAHTLGGYDQAFVLPNSFKSALVPWFAGVRKRTGWRGEMRYVLLNDLRHLDPVRLPLMVQRFCALANEEGSITREECPRPALIPDQQSQCRLLTQLQLSRASPVLGLCPGAEYGPAKQWPASGYAEVARQHIESGGQVWLFGSSRDHQVSAQILDQLPAACRSLASNLAGRTSLIEAVDLLAMTDQVVTNDSGLMHIAAALAVPLVVIYGSTSPGFTPPLAEKVGILSSKLDCSPCFKRECPLGHLKCLRDLPPDEVVNSLKDLCGRS